MELFKTPATTLSGSSSSGHSEFSLSTPTSFGSSSGNSESFPSTSSSFDSTKSSGNVSETPRTSKSNTKKILREKNRRDSESSCIKRMKEILKKRGRINEFSQIDRVRTMEMICDMCEEDLDQNRLPNTLPNTVQPLAGLQIPSILSSPNLATPSNPSHSMEILQNLLQQTNLPFSVTVQNWLNSMQNNKE